MFQYAVGRYLSITHKSNLSLDLSYYNYDYEFGPRDYELAIFNIKSDLENVHRSLIHKLLFKLKKRFKVINYVEEPSFEFFEGILNLKGNLYLTGYWQSEKYFNKIKNVIKDDFTFKTELDGTNLRLAQQISTSNSVSIHIRRGDYISGISTYKELNFLNYYQKAIHSMSELIENPQFFVFSDDIEWVKSYIEIPAAIHVEHNYGSANYIDMHLMSLCKHQIIANSSFSWWSAWLNKNQEKIVIAPLHWFNNSQIDTSDLLPNEWLKM